MAGGEDKGLEAALADHGPVVVRDDLVLEHAVVEGAVRDLDDDLVAAVELVDVAEGRAEGRAVARNRDRLAEPGEGRLLVVAGPAREVARPARSVDEDRVDAE